LKMTTQKPTQKTFSQTTWRSQSTRQIVWSSHSSFTDLRDYGANELLDRYSDRDIDDEGEFEEVSAAARRAAEAKMDRRDRLERSGKRGGRAAARSRAPRFLESDDMDDEDALDDGLGVARMKQRTRRQYDERRDLDDMDGEDVRLPQIQSSSLLMPCLNRKYHWNN
jgi:hypothetical protein